MDTLSSTQPVFAPVLAALATMQSHDNQSEKLQAHEFLEKFQKSTEAWPLTHAILQSPTASSEAKLFAATTLKGKIVYDIHQLPRQQLEGLRDSILSLLAIYRSGPRPIRIQLCVCLANLAILMIEWKDVLEVSVNALGSGDTQNGSSILEFLRILPEEFAEGRKITLTDEELKARSIELLEENGPKVMQLLIQYSQSVSASFKNPQLMQCITSWLREVPVIDIVTSPLLDTIITGLSSDDSFESSIDCLCAIFRETRDDSLDSIKILYPKILALRPKIAQAAEAQDMDAFKGITRLFSEAAESWVILIAQMPSDFQNLVDAVLECAALDQDRDAISLTFNFWYEMKIYLVLEKYIEARLQFADVFSKLVGIIIKHLEFPTPEDGDQLDLFDGDRDLEEKFREFRHQMGDVLKDSCEVIGVTECLGKSFSLIQNWIATYGSQITDTSIPAWQSLEAPLFSLRAMGRMVEKSEKIILPQLMPLIVQIPPHEKLQFAAIMVLGRYTLWTSEHPELLEGQLNFIINGFRHPSADVVRASALSLKYLCTDCSEHLGGHIVQLQALYDNVLDSLPSQSKDEVTEGVAKIVAAQPIDKLYDMMKLYCDPLIARLMEKANSAKSDPEKLAVADHVQLLTIFIEIVNPYIDPSQENPIVKYCGNMFPILSTIVDNFMDSFPICERICRCWRYMLISYRTGMLPLLPALADKLVTSFAASRQGCFLWATGTIVREFSESRELVDQNTSDAIYDFFEQQALTMLRALNDLPPKDLPDVIEDFFRLATDALLYYPYKFIASTLCANIFSAALAALTLERQEPLIATLHYLRDFISYGGLNPPNSNGVDNPPEVQQAIQKILEQNGELLVQRILTGMMFSFPRDCFTDASGVLLGLLQVIPAHTAPWIGKTVQMLPAGTVSVQESEKLMMSINQRIHENDHKKVRSILQDFTNSYRRRNVAPRDGLGQLEASRFRFSG
ncbi:MAG: Nuclear import receptor [Trizodia sp. TS-e1964]|nr:MAG: Nuclear import receptor [Trizodia sp. TS-e1964]